jgi:excisionase family DNA binding protein
VSENSETLSVPQLNLTQDGAARALGISKSSLLKLIADGEITQIPMGKRSVRIPVSELVAYNERKIAEAKAARAAAA